MLPVPLTLILSYAIWVKNKNILLLSTFMNNPYSFCFFLDRIVTPIVFTEVSPLDKGCFLEGQWVERRMIDHGKWLNLNTHHCRSNRAAKAQTGGKIPGEREQKGKLFVWYQVKKSENLGKNTVWIYSLEFKMFSII